MTTLIDTELHEQSTAPAGTPEAGPADGPEPPSWLAPYPCGSLPPAPAVEPPPPGSARRGRVLTAALAGALAGALVSTTVVAVTSADDDRSSTPVAQAVAATGEATAEPLATTATGPTVHDVIETAGPSVVSIEFETTQRRGPFTMQGTAAGSGVIISADGLVLTNAHVVEGATDLSVTLYDGTVVSGEVVGSSSTRDVALVRLLNPPTLTPATLGVSADLQVGDDVVAIGNALGLEGTPTVTKGIVSALGRELTAQDGTVIGDLIQTDAAINSGNSGGPLLDLDGRVVGINTAIILDTENLGFAIAIDAIRPVIDQLLAQG